jgi:NAD(P)H-flavin reductase
MAVLSMANDPIPDWVEQPAPRDPMVPGWATVRAIQRETPDVVTLTLELPADSRVAKRWPQPGQFNMLYLPGVGEVAISVSSANQDAATVQHTVRAVGSVTLAIRALRVGDSVGMRGPFGRPWPLEQARGSDLVIIGGGIGLAPLRSAIESIAQHRGTYGQVHILIGARTPADLLYSHEYDAWRSHGMVVIPTVDRADAQWKGKVGVVPLLLRSVRADPSRTFLFTCGPEVMMRFVVYQALASGFPKERVYLSLERNMKCGIGVCGHCQLGPYFLCKDGPVLHFGQLEPFFFVEEL